MKKIIAFVALIAIGFFLGMGYGRWYGPRAGQPAVHTEHKRGYHCPMHPSFRSDKPGNCGICGMKLVPDDEAPQEKAAEGRVLYYQDPKDPKFRSDKPGLNPETGNELVAV